MEEIVVSPCERDPFHSVGGVGIGMLLQIINRQKNVGQKIKIIKSANVDELEGI